MAALIRLQIDRSRKCVRSFGQGALKVQGMDSVNLGAIPSFPDVATGADWLIFMF